MHTLVKPFQTQIWFEAQQTPPQSVVLQQLFVVHDALHVFGQAPLFTAPRSHCSGTLITPFPQQTPQSPGHDEHVSAPLQLPSPHDAQLFVVQDALHTFGQAPLFTPVSHCSDPSTTPLPHTTQAFVVQEALHVFGQAPLFTPVSHCSDPSTTPLPHTPQALFVHDALHVFGQAPLFTAPKSHCSGALITPLPQHAPQSPGHDEHVSAPLHEPSPHDAQLFVVQDALHTLGQTPLFAPLSHDSPALITPLPQHAPQSPGHDEHVSPPAALQVPSPQPTQPVGVHVKGLTQVLTWLQPPPAWPAMQLSVVHENVSLQSAIVQPHVLSDLQTFGCRSQGFPAPRPSHHHCCAQTPLQHA